MLIDWLTGQSAVRFHRRPPDALRRRRQRSTGFSRVHDIVRGPPGKAEGKEAIINTVRSQEKFCQMRCNLWNSWMNATLNLSQVGLENALVKYPNDTSDDIPSASGFWWVHDHHYHYRLQRDVNRRPSVCAFYQNWKLATRTKLILFGLYKMTEQKCKSLFQETKRKVFPQKPLANLLHTWPSTYDIRNFLLVGIWYWSTVHSSRNSPLISPSFWLPPPPVRTSYVGGP